jgi:hypothetical protein
MYSSKVLRKMALKLCSKYCSKIITKDKTDQNKTQATRTEKTLTILILVF